MITKDSDGNPLKEGWIYVTRNGQTGIAIESEDGICLHWMTTRLNQSKLDNTHSHGLHAVMDAEPLLLALDIKIRSLNE